MNLLPNNWKAVRRHYSRFDAEILSAGRNEWGIDPYQWDNGIIHLTPIESWLWHDIRACDAVLYPQYPIAGVFVDFANPCAKVAVECDGYAYHLDKAKDDARDLQLRNLGWEVYRITGSDCRKDFDDETRTTSQAHQFIERICERHGISRSTRTRHDNSPQMKFYGPPAREDS